MPTEARRIHTRPIPRVGGVAVFASMVLGLVAVAVIDGAHGWGVPPDQRAFFLGILLGGGIVFFTGLLDDVLGLSPLAKLAAQCVAAGVVFFFGFRVEALSLGPAAEFSLGWLSLPLTILWVVAVTNAFNLIDGLDGLATGIAVVALATTLAVALALGNVEVAIVCVVLLGALLGFLRYNFSPARIFLGDSGSLFIGFMLAVLSVHGSTKSATAVLVLIPLFALALPLLDTGLAIARRWLRGSPLSGADARHIHHRLLAIGLTHRRAAAVLYLIAVGLAMLGLSLVFAPPTAIMAIAIAGGGLSVVLLLLGMRHLEYHEFAEAGAVVASGVLRVRRVIRDQICARDVAQLITRAETLPQIDRILAEYVSHFGFLAMEICREMSPGRQRPLLNGQGSRAWKLDYPVMARDGAADDPYVLRIWCGPNAERPFGAERVARILAPVIERWFAERELAQQVPESARAAAGTKVLSFSGSELPAAVAWGGAPAAPLAPNAAKANGTARGRVARNGSSRHSSRPT